MTRRNDRLENRRVNVIGTSTADPDRRSIYRMRFLFGLILGTVAGVVAAVAHSGPVDQPIVGLVIASALVISGAWLAHRAWERAGWFGYLLAVAGATMWLIFVPPRGDILITGNGWTSELWTALSLVCAVIPVVLESFRRRGSVSSEKDETYID